MLAEEVARERLCWEHYHELLHEAEKARLVRQALAGRPGPQALLSRLLKGMGRGRMVRQPPLPARSVADRPLQPRPVVDRTR